MDDSTALGAVLNPPQLERFRELCEVDGPIEPRFGGFTKLVLLADDRAFLFPRNHTIVGQLERECDIYAAVDHRLVPRLRGSWSDVGVSPYPFFAVTRLAGSPIGPMDPESIPSVAEQLGAAMAAFHDTPLDLVSDRVKKDKAAEAMGTSHYTPIRFLGGIEHVATTASSFIGASASESAAIAEAIGVVEAMAPVLAHGDLHEQQLLVDESGTLTGILDWGFAGVISPLCDFTCSQFKGELLAGEPSYGDMRRHLWDAYVDGRSAGLPTWAQIHLAMTAFDIAALAPDHLTHYYWHQGEQWRATRRDAAGACLRTLLR